AGQERVREIARGGRTRSHAREPRHPQRVPAVRDEDDDETQTEERYPDHRSPGSPRRRALRVAVSRRRMVADLRQPPVADRDALARVLEDETDGCAGAVDLRQDG